MARLAAGDRAAFTHLVNHHLPSLHRYVHRLTGSAVEAEDLCQETFLRVWQRPGAYQPGRVRLTTWLHRVAHNLAVDQQRRRREIPASDGAAGDMAEDPLGAAAGDRGGNPAEDPAGDPAGRLAAHQAGHRLHAALAALPANQRAALVLCRVQGFSNAEAAAILGVGVRSVESLIARARRSLRRHLQQQADEPPSSSATDAAT